MPNQMLIDKSKPIPLYYQIKEQLQRRIEKGELKPFERLPSEAEMVEMYKISRATVRQAFTELVNDGLIFREHGKGTYVAEIKEDSKIKILTSKSLAFLIPNIMADIYPEILRGVEDVAHNRGYSVIVCNTDSKAEKQKQYLHKMDEQRVGGLLIAPICWEQMAVEHYRELEADGIPFVFINQFISELECDYVITDNVFGAYQAVCHLIRLGHKRIAYISLPKYATTEQRMMGYQRALSEHGIVFDKSLVRRGNSVEERPGYKYTKELLESENCPTAIFAFNDAVAKDVYDAVIEMGLRVPEDIALVGFDDSVVARSMGVPLTTVAYPSYETGTLASKILIDRIEGKQMPVQHCVLQTSLIVRQSCGARLKQGDADVMIGNTDK